jgi:hypothetical protein
MEIMIIGINRWLLSHFLFLTTFIPFSNSCAIIISAVALATRPRLQSKTSIQDFNPRLQNHMADTTSTA